MQLPFFQVDAFTDRVFGGNPAAVIPLREWLEEATLQSIAAENNLSETAFFVPDGTTDGFQLRWFTPVREVRLCGHATLATAHVLFNHLGYTAAEITFQTQQAGLLRVKRTDKGYSMDFPADTPRPVDPPEPIQLALGLTPSETFMGEDDLLVIVDQEDYVERLEPNLDDLRLIDRRGVIVSAPGSSVDFVSRCFFPRYGIDEDPVTGSAHTLLTPYWAHRLQKNSLTAIQASPRRGHLRCTLAGERVHLEGQAVTYLVGEILV